MPKRSLSSSEAKGVGMPPIMVCYPLTYVRGLDILA